MSVVATSLAWLRKFRRAGFILGCFYLLYALLGFFLLPRLLKPRVIRGLSQALHREARLRSVKVNPLVLSVTLEGVEVRARDGAPWLGCQLIYANLQLWPLLNRTFELKTLELDRPSYRLKLDQEGNPEFLDLLKGESEPAAPGKPWILAIDHFALGGGQAELSDRSPKEEFKSSLGPLNIHLEGFRTRLGASSQGTFEAWTEAGEHLAWTGRITVEPPGSEGTLRLERLDLPKYDPYLQEALSLQLRGGRASLVVPYRFQLGQKKAVEIRDAEVSLEGLDVRGLGGQQALLLRNLKATGLQADLLANRVEIGRLLLNGGDFSVERDPKGSLNWSRLFDLPPGVNPKPKNPKAKPLDLTLREVSLEGGSLRWRDALPARPVQLELKDLALTLRDLTLDSQRPAHLDLQARVGEAGRLHLSGPLRLLGFAATFEAEGDAMALGTFDPYFEPALDLRILKGTLGLKGRLGLAFEGRPKDGVSYSGDAWIQNLEAADGRDLEPLLRWRRLDLLGLTAQTGPPAVKLRRLAWASPEGRVVVARDGTTNATRALNLDPVPPSAAAAVIPPAPPKEGPPMPLTIGVLAVEKGRLSFVDRSLEPNAALLLSELEGTYRLLSTDPALRSQLHFSGMAGGIGPVLIEGQAYPFRTDQDTDVQIAVKGADLVDFDPYARKYLGYVLQKGKLGTDTRLRIQHRSLEAQIAVKLDQLYLGDKVESKDATWIPVKLALAILRDRHGVITLELPIGGSLDDPDIHWGRVAWKAVLNVLGKAATSPFVMLGNLFGDGADLSAVAFAPGSSELDAATQKVVAGLVKSLQERPALSLELEGTFDPVADGAVLRRNALEAKLKAEAHAADSLSPTQREAALRALHAATFPVDPKGPQVAEPPLAEMESRLLGQLIEDLDGLRNLAEARTDAVQQLLISGGAPVERVFPVKGTLKPEQKHATKVWFAVK